MKRSIALAALATLASGAALAQSTVTVYGRLNVSVERQKQITGIDDTTGAVSDRTITALQNSSSRIGFKGQEDLGGGLYAAFLLEHGFSPDTGAAASTFWGRESWVALGGNFGRVRLGNMGPTAAYFGTADYISNHNHDTGTSADNLYLYQGTATNMIAYNSPNVGGFSGELQFGLKENGTKNTTVLRGDYDAGPLHVGAVYLNGTDGYGPNLGLAGTTGAKQWGLRGLYEMGPFTVGAYYVADKIEAPGADLKRNAFRVSGMYTVGASEFHLNYGLASKIKVNGTTVDESGANQVTVAYNYNLSKRTKVYAFYTKLGGDAAAEYASINAASSAKSAFALGVRHNF